MGFLKKYFGDWFITRRFYVTASLCAAVYIISYFVPLLENFGDIFITVFAVLCLVDYILLFFMAPAPSGKRKLSERMSNGDNNNVLLTLKNNANFPLQIKIIDELPYQFQERDFGIQQTLEARQQVNVRYKLRPVERGEYTFGNLILLAASPLHFFRRRFSVEIPNTVHVYPSFQKLRTNQLLAKPDTTRFAGQRRMRRLGQSMEFEQIKEYVSGDDIRTINWKATARKGGLMVNNYVDEKSQQVYAIIDKGRLMKMPFKKLSLLDYAINSTLALANLSLLKQDKFGLVSFSNKMGSLIPADRRPVQRENIMRALYKEETAFKEADFEMLYLQVRHYVKQRSLLILFTNFESLRGMQRQLNYLRSIARYHLLLIVIFENSELTKVASASVNNVEDVYVKTISEKFVNEKKTIVKELQNYGISAILSSPENLTVNLLNKYLELKAKQMI